MQAYAQDYARKGFYTGVGGSAAFEDFDIGGLDVDTVAPGVNFKAGYRFLPNFAGEFDFLYVDGWEVEDVIDLTALAFSARGKGYLSTGRIQPYAAVGVGVVEGDASVEVFGVKVSTDETEFAANFGGGVDFYATKNIVLYAEATYYLTTGDLDDFPFIPVNMGFQFRF